MRAHYLQHVPFEGLGSIAPWLAGQGYRTTATRLFEAAAFPDPRDIDLLVILGGPMSVNDGGELPWLAAEKAFIREVIGLGTPVLGICLGAQLIAEVLGARVYPGPAREIGWFPVHGVANAEGADFVLPPQVSVFHWHGETFDLPPGARRLARSAACENQAFQWGVRVIGLQFHLETTPESARALVAHCRHELSAGAFVQDEQQILAAPAAGYTAINRLMAEVLAYLTRASSDRQAHDRHPSV
ncbi:MAG: type 1 glutamine amidotransferase [Pseudomonadota bacterium]